MRLHGQGDAPGRRQRHHLPQRRRALREESRAGLPGRLTPGRRNSEGMPSASAKRSTFGSSARLRPCAAASETAFTSGAGPKSQ
jgi:hypothetical protein